MLVNENFHEISEQAQKKYSKMSSKGLEIILIILNFLTFLVLFIFTLIANLSSLVLIFIPIIITLIMIFLNLIFSIALRCSQSKKIIDKKRSGICLTKVGFTFTIVLLVLCVIGKLVKEYYSTCEELKDLKINYPYLNTAYAIAEKHSAIINKDKRRLDALHCEKILSKTTQIKILYAIFAIIEILSIYQIWLWKNLKNRLVLGSDESPLIIHIGTQTTKDESKRQEENIPFPPRKIVIDNQVNDVSIFNDENNLNKKNK